MRYFIDGTDLQKYIEWCKSILHKHAGRAKYWQERAKSPASRRRLVLFVRSAYEQRLHMADIEKWIRHAEYDLQASGAV